MRWILRLTSIRSRASATLIWGSTTSGSSSARCSSSSCKRASRSSRPVSAGRSTLRTCVSTNFAIFGIGFVAFFLVGFPIMFSGFSYPPLRPHKSLSSESRSFGNSGHWVFLWGKSGWALSGAAYSVPIAAFFLYMVAFMDTTATIPTGAMAERWKWKAFVGWGLFCGALYYPIFGGWTWGGGWLSQLGNSIDSGFGYVDFAGSGVVHAMGGVAGLAGAIVLGARIGKYGPDGKPRTLAAHNIPMAHARYVHPAVRLVRLQRRIDVRGDRPALRGRGGEHRPSLPRSVQRSAMFYVMKRMGKPDPGMMVNGMLAGLVAITAPCAFVQPWAAAVIGAIAAIIIVESVFFFERKGIDDPVGRNLGARRRRHLRCALRRHLRRRALRRRLEPHRLLVHQWQGRHRLPLRQRASASSSSGAQAIGALVICTVMFGIAYAFFKIQNAVMKGGIRRGGGRRDRRARPSRDGRARLRQPAGSASSTSSGSTRTSSSRAELRRTLRSDARRTDEAQRVSIGGTAPCAVPPARSSTACRARRSRRECRPGEHPIPARPPRWRLSPNEMVNDLL